MLDQFARQNRWWADPRAIIGDRHLVRVDESRIRWTPSLPFQFDRDAVYTLRGPRQVGKSTVIKRQIQALLEAGWPARKILYLDVELAGLRSASDLVQALRWYLDSELPSANDVAARCAIFLDEITRVENWAGALRGLVDNGELRGTTIVATGSHTRDLRAGGERLPGRRGGSELDWELLPLSFREYAALADPTLSLPPLLPSLARNAVRANRLGRAAVRPRLAALFERYLATGGFLLALNDEATYGLVRAETFQVYREAIVGEFTRAGMRESYLRELINWLSRHLGREFDYRDIATETDIGSKDTARNYVDNLEACYVALVCYRVANIDRLVPGFRGPKKVHPVDPLFWHLVHAWAAADPDPWPASLASLQDSEAAGRLVESVVAAHLRRAFGPRVYYRRSNGQHEIDFVVAPGRAATALLEVRYQRSIGDRDARDLAAEDGGLLLTRSWEGDLAAGAVYALPAPELLAMLNAPSLARCWT